jgi:hypothetical protein
VWVGILAVAVAAGRSPASNRLSDHHSIPEWSNDRRNYLHRPVAVDPNCRSEFPVVDDDEFATIIVVVVAIIVAVVAIIINITTFLHGPGGGGGDG